MVTDLDIIKNINEEIGRRLKPIGLNRTLRYGGGGYGLDEQKNVICLSLSNLIEDTLPAALFQLRHLEQLDLSSTELSDLPAEIARLKNLRKLYLSSNYLSSLPEEITGLQELRELYLGSNQFSSIPSCVVQLCNLRALYMSSNQLSELPSEIDQLQKLITLDLSLNRLSSLPKEIFKLRKLRYFSLSSNRLSSLPMEIASFDLEFSLVNRFPVEAGVYLDGNPLESPPVEIVSKGRQAIIEYFRSLHTERHALNELKILVVGDGAVGKTSLVKRLLNGVFDPNESQTHGVNIRQWSTKNKTPKILGHLWDFGGQEIMHATHQFFLSKRSLYILVLDGRKDEKVNYWLKTIESFGGDSPVLVVLNKMDQNPGFDVNRRFLKKKYPGIQGFYPVSCASNTGIADFREAIQLALGKVEIVGTTWPKSWFQVKQSLEKMKDHFISYDRYTDLCERVGIKEKSIQGTLVDFLNDLGVVVHFQDFDLQDVYVLEPKWVTEGVYKIINSDELARAKGILRLRQLAGILKPRKDYPRSKHRYVVDLMKKFDLCYKIDRESVLVPDLLEVPRASLRLRLWQRLEISH